MPNIPDNYDKWLARDWEQNQWLDSLPKCEICEEPIQQERAVCLDGKWYCDECLEMNRVEVEAL